MEDLPNPVINEEDQETANLLEAAGFADRGEDIPADILKGDKAETVETEENFPTAEELADPANKDRARDPKSGKFIKRQDSETALEAQPGAADASKTTPTGELSPFEQKKQEKAAKEKERQDRSWENLNRQKEELEQRRREIAEYEQRARQPQQQRQPEQRQFSSKDLLEASDDFKKNARDAFKRYQETGDEAALDEFNKQDQLAEQAFADAGQFFQVEQQEAQQAHAQRHASTWNHHMLDAMKAEPDLGKTDSELSKHVQRILEVNGKELWMFEDGFNKAVELAKLRMDAKDAPTLREQLKTMKAEVDRLNGLTAPTPGGVTTPGKTKKFEDMSDQEQDAWLRRQAAAVDAGV